MMSTAAYHKRKDELETYFDRTAVDAWAKLTSDAPVGRIRRTVRAGRDSMRAKLLSWLPADLSGLRLLDAGCGTGALSVEAARRGAEVVAIDISATLVNLAAERLPRDLGRGRIDFRVGDMLDPALGRFDAVVAMDSLIHYETADIARALAALAPRVSGPMLITIAPQTPLLTVMHRVGRLFPRGDRAPAIVPVSAAGLARAMTREPNLAAGAWPRRIAPPAASISRRPCASFRGSVRHECPAPPHREDEADRSALPAFRGCGFGRIAVGPAAAARLVSGLGGDGLGAAARHAQPGDDRRTRRLRLAGGAHGGPALPFRAVPRAGGLPVGYASLGFRLAAGALRLGRHDAPVRGARHHALLAAAAGHRP